MIFVHFERQTISVMIAAPASVLFSRATIGILLRCLINSINLFLYFGLSHAMKKYTSELCSMSFIHRFSIYSNSSPVITVGFKGPFFNFLYLSPSRQWIPTHLSIFSGMFTFIRSLNMVLLITCEYKFVTFLVSKSAIIPGWLLPDPCDFNWILTMSSLISLIKVHPGIVI